jgi:hypothetical protein
VSEYQYSIKECSSLPVGNINFLREKAVEATKQKDEKRKRPSPRNRKACHSLGTALLKSVAEMGTRSAMESSRKTLHELSPHNPRKTPKRSISSWTTRRKYATINSEWKY